MPVELTKGAVIADRYRLEHLLGEGGMGAVWAATHTVTRKHVALKFLKTAAAERPDVVRRFLREARAASAVRHPNVVQIHDIVQVEGGLPVMVMDLLVGESLGQKLQREQSIALPELARILVPVISAVGTAHALGIIHRDLKPDNIFLVRLTDGGLDPRVLDFGIAKLTADDGDAARTAGLTQTGSMLGTPYYMSPEQAFGEKGVDQRADVWAMGVILYQCLTGRRPVSGENLGQLFKVLMSGDIVPLRQVAPHLPEDACSLVERMMVTDRARRLPDLRESLSVLRRYSDVTGQTFDAPRTPIQDPITASSGTTPAGAPTPMRQPPSSTTPALDGSTVIDMALAPTAASNPGHTPSIGASAGGPARPSTAAPLVAAARRAPGPRPSRSAVLLVVGAAVAIGVGGLAAARLLRAPSAETPPETHPTSAAAAAPEAPEGSTAGNSSADQVASTAGASPSPSAPPAVRAGASTRPSTGAPPLPPGAGVMSVAVTAPSAETTTPELRPSSAKATTTPEPRPSATTRPLPGGVVGDVPF